MKNDIKNIICPKCGESISINEALARQIKDGIESEKSKLEKDIYKKAEEKLQIELKDKDEQIKEKNEELKEAQEAQLKALKKEREADEKIKKADLELEKRLRIERSKIEEDSSKKASEEKQVVIDQMAKQISDATKANEELRRKLEQRSQQTQGEVQEIKLEELLRSEFIYDDISPVPKGENGADVIQTVKTKKGIECGKIIWESKKTKSWSNGWIQKLKDDQRLVGAECAVIVSFVLPKGVENSVFKDDVWICDLKSALSIATALRYALETVSNAKRTLVGKNDKKEILYSYLTGTAFTQKIQTIAETFISMGNDLSKERNLQEKIWAEREKQIKKIKTNIVGIVVDLNETVPLQKIGLLELPEASQDKK